MAYTSSGKSNGKSKSGELTHKDEKSSEVEFPAISAHMLFPDVFRQALQNPRLQNGLLRTYPLLWAPHQKLLHELHELRILAITQDHLNRLRPRLPYLPLAVRLYFRQLPLEKLRRTTPPLDQRPRRHPQHFHEHHQLLRFILPGEDGVADKKLAEDAAQGPNIDGGGIRDPEYDLRGPVVATLDVGVDLFGLVAPRTHVDDLHSRLVLVLE